MAEEQTFTLKYTGQEINDKLNHISEIDKLIENLQEKDTELSTNITTVSTAVTGYGADISGLNDRITNNRTDITVLQNSTRKHTQDINGLQDKDISLEKEIALKVDITTYNDRVGKIEQDVNNQNSKYDQFTNAINRDYNNRITNNETNINSLNTRVFGNDEQSISKEIDDKVAGLDQGYRSAVEELKNELNLKITSNTDNISGLEERVTALEGIEQPDLTDYIKSEDLSSNSAIIQLQEAINALIERVTKLENNAQQPPGQ